MTKLKDIDREKLFQIINIVILLLIVFYYLARAIYYRQVIDHGSETALLPVLRSLYETA